MIFLWHTMSMLSNNNILRQKSDLYFDNHLRKYSNHMTEEGDKEQFYYFVSLLFQRVISYNNSDFSKEEENLIENFDIDVVHLLDYLKVDIKNFIVESGKTNT